MTHDSRRSDHARTIRIAALAVVLAGSIPTGVRAADGPPQTAAAGTNVHAAALQEFQNRLQGYLTLRERLAQQLKPLTSSASSAEITARQDALAAALRAARKTAKPGDLVPEPAARFIRDTIVADFKARRASAKRGEVEEIPQGVVPVINKAYPAQAALPTMPALLLKELPVLPDNLQYRFFARHVVILDGDLQIIADYIANVLPAQ